MGIPPETDSLVFYTLHLRNCNSLRLVSLVVYYITLFFCNLSDFRRLSPCTYMVNCLFDFTFSVCYSEFLIAAAMNLLWLRPLRTRFLSVGNNASVHLPRHMSDDGNDAKLELKKWMDVDSYKWFLPIQTRWKVWGNFSCTLTKFLLLLV